MDVELRRNLCRRIYVPRARHVEGTVLMDIRPTCTAVDPNRTCKEESVNAISSCGLEQVDSAHRVDRNRLRRLLVCFIHIGNRR